MRRGGSSAGTVTEPIGSMKRGRLRGRRARWALGLFGAAVLLLAAAQLLLPRIAADQISARVGRYGSVQSVSVSAWPAVKLLWGSVDSVSVRARGLSMSPAQTAKLLWEARDVNDMDLTAASVREGPLQLSDASFRKRGSALSAQALTTQAAVKAALPEGFDVQLLGGEAGKVQVRASGGLFGVGASVDAVAAASEGKLVVHPQGFLVEGLALTLFTDPHVYVEAVGASAVAVPGGAQGYRLTIAARLR